MRRATIFLLILVAPASALAEPTNFDLVAYETPGMDPNEQIILVRDAQTRLPKLLRACGIRAFRQISATDGAVVYRFSADPAGRPVACLRRRMPAGGQLLS